MGDTEGLNWRKSSYSSNGGECVEVASGDGHAVYVRDTKRREAGTLAVGADVWRAFLAKAKDGKLSIGLAVPWGHTCKGHSCV